MECELPLIGATQGQHRWWTKGLVGSRSTQRNWTEGWTTVKSVAQEGRKVKPILPTIPSRFTDRKTSRTNLTTLKPAEDFFSLSFPHTSFFLSVVLSFFIPSSFHPLLFYSFFLPSFIYFFILIFVKIPSSYLSSDLYFFFLPSIPFLFLNPSFILIFFLFFLLFEQVRK